jgi:hypothetical protein
MKQSAVLDIVKAITEMLPQLEDHYSLCRKLSSVYQKLLPEAQGFDKDREKINVKFGIPITVFTSTEELPSMDLAKPKKEGEPFTYQIDTDKFDLVKGCDGVKEIRHDQYRIPAENIVLYNEAVEQLLSTDIEVTDRIKGALFDGVKMPKFGAYIAMLNEIIED